MWIYVPNASTSSVSALEAEASISASNWQFEALAAFAWSRGKPSLARNWFQLWRRALWLQRLYGAMPEPSTAAHGVARWTALLAASRASRTALPGESEEALTIATSGPMHGASSSNPAAGLSSSKTSAACFRRGLTKSLEPNGYGEIFASLVSRLRSDCSRRRKSARRTSASGCSSSGWPTATANMVTGAGSSGRDGGDNLQTAAINWPASAWPTPTANDWKGSGPTLERKDGQMRGDRLDYAAEQLWSTPRSSDGEKGGPNQAFGAGGTPLPAQAAQWATSSVADTTGGRMTRSGERSDEPLLKGQSAALSSRLHPMLYPVGQVSSHPRRSLNPLFVEWLMGWPPGWTLLAWTDFACSETALSLWRQRMRSELLSLGLPREAPPAQLALFG
jgi:hypothetical protein